MTEEFPTAVEEVKVSSVLDLPERNIENRAGLEQDLLAILAEKDFPTDTVNVFKNTILAKLKFVSSETGPSFFRNLQIFGEGQEGESVIILSDRTIKSRAARLEGLVPADMQESIAQLWLAAHELGHGLEAAYGIANKVQFTEGFMKGLYDYPNPADKYVAEFPEDSWSKNVQDAQRIERERRAEGIAQELLTAQLLRMGLDNHTIINILHKAYEPNRLRAAKLAPLMEQTNEETALRDTYDGRLGDSDTPDIDANLAIHEFGYANPMPIDEIARRYQVL